MDTKEKQIWVNGFQSKQGKKKERTESKGTKRIKPTEKRSKKRKGIKEYRDSDIILSPFFPPRFFKVATENQKMDKNPEISGEKKTRALVRTR